MAKSVPEKILDNTILAHIDLLRLSEAEKLRAEALLVDLRGKLITKLGKSNITGSTRTAVQNKRLKDLYKSVDGIIEANFNNLSKSSTRALNAMAKYEEKASAGIVNDAIGVEVIAPELSVPRLKGIVNNAMVDGEIIGDWWKSQAGDFKDRFKDTMDDIMKEFRAGMLEGQTVGQMVSALSASGKLMGYTRNNVEALVRTSFMSVASDVREEMYAENADILSGTQWVSTLDGRTTPICKALDGQKWDNNQKPINPPYMRYRRWPAHWQCRSVTVPITLTYEEMLGKRPQLSKLDSKQRASMNGPVPSKVNYDEWLKALPEEKQIEILGPGRFELMKKGKLNMADMLRPDGSPLTIKQLEAKVEKGFTPTPKPKTAPAKKVGAEKPFILSAEEVSAKKVGESLKKYEAEIVKRKTEKAYVLDRNGEVVFSKSGSKTGIEFTFQETMQMKGNVLTHNHPRDTSFSPEDIQIANMTGMKEIRAVGKRYTYSGKVTKQIEHAVYSAEYRKSNKTVHEFIEKKFLDNTMSIDEANAIHAHLVMKDLSKRVDWFEYKRTLTK